MTDHEEAKRRRRNLLNMADAVVADYRRKYGHGLYTDADRRANLEAFLDSLGDDE